MMLKSLMVRMKLSSVVTIITCLSPGRVTCQKRRHAEAPSTDAASYCSRGMLCRPARKETPKKGNPRHQLATITAIIAPSGVAMKAIGRLRSPRSSSTLLKKPRPGKASNIHRQVSAMITVEVIHGSRKRPRKKFRPRITLLSTRAMSMPVTTLRPTEPIVKTKLFRTTWWKVSSSAR